MFVGIKRITSHLNDKQTQDGLVQLIPIQVTVAGQGLVQIVNSSSVFKFNLAKALQIQASNCYLLQQLSTH